jgi:hypothetical protein
MIRLRKMIRTGPIKPMLEMRNTFRIAVVELDGIGIDGRIISK